MPSGFEERLIVKTFSDYGIDVHGKNEQEETTCPRCSADRKPQNQKKPCLSVNHAKGKWNCHHCGRSGGLVTGWSDLKQERPTKMEYQPKVLKRPSYNAPAILHETALGYLKRRGISEDVVKANKIGWGASFGSNYGIQFPYYKGGQVVNIKHRSMSKEFRQEKDAEKVLYRFDEISKCQGDTLIITEGEFDALSVQVAGFDMVTSVPDGAPAVNTLQYSTKFNFLLSCENLFKHYKKIILAVDADDPGRVLEAELARRIGAEKCYRVKFPDGCKDSNDVLVKFGVDALRAVIKNAVPYPVEGIFTPKDYEEAVLNLYDLGVNRGVMTGWPILDQFYIVKTGEMTIVTGIPASGKSNFVDALMVNLVESHGWSFAVFSPENWPVERHLQTLLEKFERKPFAKDGYHESRMERKSVIEMLGIINNHFNFIVLDEGLLTVETILEKARIAVFRYGIKGLVIDPWNELDHVYANMTEAQYLSEKLTKIRRFARLNGIHIWVVAHPKNLVKDKDGVYKPPTMYEISGGAHWRNKADNGICVHRPDYKNDITEIYIQKIRFKEVGRTGDVKLQYSRDTGTYSQLKEV